MGSPGAHFGSKLRSTKGLTFAFTNLFLPKYRVEYYDCIAKWCSVIYNVIGVYRWILPKL